MVIEPLCELPPFVDVDGALFPLAFGLVDVETDESGMWFLMELHKLLEMGTEKIPQFSLVWRTERHS